MASRSETSFLNCKVSFYAILVWSNIIVFILSAVSYNGLSHFVDGVTIFFSAIMTLIVFLLINDARRNQNPLLGVMAFLLILFFQLRVFSLEYTDYSVVLDRIHCTPADLNRTYLFIIVATLVMWRAFHFHRLKDETQSGRVREISFSKVQNLLYFTLFISLLEFLPFAFTERFTSILTTLFFNSMMILMFSFACFMRIHKRLSATAKTIFILSLVLFVLISIFKGSRGGIMSIFYVMIPSILVEKKEKIKMKYLIGVLLLLPIAVGIFSYSTYMRKMNIVDESNIRTKIELLPEVIQMTSGSKLKETLSPVLDRVGFLDYATESVKKADEFRLFVNPVYCFKSIVDNALTPGFDVFDVAKESNAVKIYYETGGLVPRSKLSIYDYQSDEFTLFGEAYIMFYGWLSLLPLFLIAYLFKSFYIKYYRRDDYLKMPAVIYLFIVLFNSFGFDWFVLNLVSMIFNYLIFYWVTGTRTRSPRILQMEYAR